MVDKEISNEKGKGTGKVILKITCVDFVPRVLYFALICARNYRRVVYTTPWFISVCLLISLTLKDLKDIHKW